MRMNGVATGGSAMQWVSRIRTVMQWLSSIETVIIRGNKICKHHKNAHTVVY